MRANGLRMLSVAQCRALLPGAGEGLTDAEVEHLRDALAAIAGLALDRATKMVDATLGGEGFDLVPTDLHEEVQERAAIMEFDGGLPRERAERAAFAVVLGGRREA